MRHPLAHFFGEVFGERFSDPHCLGTGGASGVTRNHNDDVGVFARVQARAGDDARAGAELLQSTELTKVVEVRVLASAAAITTATDHDHRTRVVDGSLSA